MIIRKASRVASGQKVEVAELLYVTPAAAFGYKLLIYHCEHSRIIYRTVVVEVAEPEMIRHSIELVVLSARNGSPAQRDGVEERGSEAETVTLVDRAYERHIELRVMSGERCFSAEFYELGDSFLLLGRVLHHFVGDAGYLRYLFGNRLFGVNESTELLNYLHSAELHCAYFGEPAGRRAETRGLGIEYDEFVVYAP